jgi:hypothetical protein
MEREFSTDYALELALDALHAERQSLAEDDVMQKRLVRAIRDLEDIRAGLRKTPPEELPTRRAIPEDFPSTPAPTRRRRK